MVHSMSFLSKPTLKFEAKFKFWEPDPHDKWDAMLQGETSIDDRVVYNIPYMHVDD